MIKIYNVDIESKEEILTEIEGYEKYGQKGYILYPLFGLVFGIIAAITFILIMSLHVKENYFEYLGIFTIVIGGIEQFLLFLNCCKLASRLYEKVTITSELLGVLISYFLALGISNLGILLRSRYGNDFFEANDLITIISLLLLARNLAWISITIFGTVASSKKFILIEYSENPECSKSLEKILCSKTGALYFSKYICWNYNPQGCDVFNLFTLLISWKEKKRYNKDAIPIDIKIKEAILESEYIRELISEDSSNIEITKILREELKKYYNEFKNSNEYLDLNGTLKNKQIINDRLRYANLM